MAKYGLVIFDMDGTLTEELLDFPAIRAEIGVTPESGILEHIAGLPPEEARRANEILDRHELAAADRCPLHEGAIDLLNKLRVAGIPTALLTRNSPACAQRVLSRHSLKLDYIATRNDRPHKPHPDSILNITRRMGVPPERTLMVGDYIYDLQAATAAGTESVLLCMRDGGKRPAFAAMATYCVATLPEVWDVVQGKVNGSQAQAIAR